MREGGERVSRDRRTGYWDREKETMTAAARRTYQDGWVRDLVAHAWAAAPGVRRRMERAGLTPADIGGVVSSDLAVVWCHRRTRSEWVGAGPPQQSRRYGAEFTSRSTMVFR